MRLDTRVVVRRNRYRAAPFARTRLRALAPAQRSACLNAPARIYAHGIAHASQIMWIEKKSGGLAGPARIGRVTFSKSGQSLSYRGSRFRKLKGGGFKSNYIDTETNEHYWISGCRRDGVDALYSTDVTIDDDVRKEYWTEIRGRPDQEHITSFRASGKY